MKRIINGRLYDTETAKELDYHENMANRSDYRYLCETLYRKRNKEFFMHLEGGPLSEAAEIDDDGMMSSGEKIMPLSTEQARRWCEENLDVDTYQALFGPVSEGSEQNIVELNLSSSKMKALKDKAEESSKSISKLLNEFINDYLNN